MTYVAPLADLRFTLQHVAGLDAIAALPGHAEVTPDLVDAVLAEAGRLAAEVIAPLGPVGDREGAVLENGVVRAAPGYREAYDQFRAGGWNALPFHPDQGGQGLPWAVAIAVSEIWQAADLSFSLVPMLTQGAIEALAAHGSRELQRAYLPRLVSGEWTGTMNLTEPQAGSDIGALRTRAVRQEDGSYRITGQKIFITWGDHDLAGNIVHLVLARTPDAPPGTKGISLFVVPKRLPRDDGSPGAANDLRVAGLEHKLGIHASPTCVMAFGDAGGATGYLVGEESRGIECMFTMMNNARLSVGVQGVALGERAYQLARAYALSRIQGRPVGRRGDAPASIAAHPDVRRMLLTMRAQVEAGRALALTAAATLDRARLHPDAGERAHAQARVDLLTPVVKAWCTDAGCDAASLGIQVHGGMGYIEETGAARLYRDVRIAPIYEGTNGIQANDLVFRKIARDDGRAGAALISEMRALDPELARAPGDDAAAIRTRLSDGVAALETATAWIVATAPRDHAAVAAGSAHYLRIFGLVAGGWLLAKAALAALSSLADPSADHAFLTRKLVTARFFADQLLPQARGLLLPVTEGWPSVTALADDEV